MPSGDREFFELSPHRAYVLEGGGELLAPQIAYETWGNLDAAAGNAVLVCHALTGDAHAYGDAGPGQPTPAGGTILLVPVGRSTPTDTLLFAPMFLAPVREPPDQRRLIQLLADDGAATSQL